MFSLTKFGKKYLPKRKLISEQITVIVAAINKTYVNFPKKFATNKLDKVINNKKSEE